MPFRLSGLLLNRVDLCPAGANPGAEIALFKSTKEEDVPAPKKKVAATKAAKVDSRSKTKQRGDEEDETDEDDSSVTTSDDDIVVKADDGDEGDEDDAEVVEEDEEEEEEDRPTKKTKLAKKVKKASAPVTTDEDSDDLEDIDTDVMKSLPLSVQKTIMRSQSIAKRALAMATVEKDRRVSLEFIEKAKTEIPNLTGSAEEKGEALKALYSGQPIVKAVADRILKLLKSADAAIRTTLMSDFGNRRTRTDEDSAVAQLEAKRDEILTADPTLTKQQAMARATTEHPTLYKAYRIEKQRARRDADVN